MNLKEKIFDTYGWEGNKKFANLKHSFDEHVCLKWLSEIENVHDLSEYSKLYNYILEYLEKVERDINPVYREARKAYFNANSSII